MAPFLRLMRDISLAFLGSALLGWYVTRGVSPLGSELVTSLRVAFTWAVPVELALSAGAAWLFTRTCRSAVARAAALTREEAVAAAISAHRLPVRMGLTVLGLSALGVLLLSWPA
ncbi:MAG: hypothetical protein WCC48_19210, partial [Anaeromyxobacteraceae bacterium]